MSLVSVIPQTVRFGVLSLEKGNAPGWMGGRPGGWHRGAGWVARGSELGARGADGWTRIWEAVVPDGRGPRWDGWHAEPGTLLQHAFGKVPSCDPRAALPAAAVPDGSRSIPWHADRSWGPAVPRAGASGPRLGGWMGGTRIGAGRMIGVGTAVPDGGADQIWVRAWQNSGPAVRPTQGVPGPDTQKTRRAPTQGARRPDTTPTQRAPGPDTLKVRRVVDTQRRAPRAPKSAELRYRNLVRDRRSPI